MQIAGDKRHMKAVKPLNGWDNLIKSFLIAKPEERDIFFLRVLDGRWFPDTVPTQAASAASGNLMEMQLRPHPSPTDSATLGTGSSR